VSVRVSPISRAAAVLIIIVGVITFFLINSIAGVAFIVLGAALYVLLYRFRSRLEAELKQTDG
jgi:membrane protein implicated in regulation of membrane protease activity